jgi:hypothetical protein
MTAEGALHGDGNVGLERWRFALDLERDPGDVVGRGHDQRTRAAGNHRDASDRVAPARQRAHGVDPCVVAATVVEDPAEHRNRR